MIISILGDILKAVAMVVIVMTVLCFWLLLTADTSESCKAVGGENVFGRCIKREAILHL